MTISNESSNVVPAKVIRRRWLAKLKLAAFASLFIVIPVALSVWEESAHPNIRYDYYPRTLGDNLVCILIAAAMIWVYKSGEKEDRTPNAIYRCAVCNVDIAVDLSTLRDGKPNWCDPVSKASNEALSPGRCERCPRCNVRLRYPVELGKVSVHAEQ